MPSFASIYGSTMGVARETDVAEASGPVVAGKSAAYWWVFIVGMILAARIVYEWAD
jgi:hypothetical protein